VLPIFVITPVNPLTLFPSVALPKKPPMVLAELAGVLSANAGQLFAAMVSN
jgi:hypothetical protein